MGNWTRRGWIASACAALGLGANAMSDERSSPPPPPGPDRADAPAARFFSIEALLKERSPERPYHPFLDEPTLAMGMYVLAKGARDTQQPHDLDEVYVVWRGRGRFTAEGETRPVTEGDILFVRAHAEHRFHDIEEDLELVVVFSKAAP